MAELDDINFGDIGTFDADIDLSAFGGINIDGENLEEPRYIKPRARAVRTSHIKYDNAKALADAIDCTKKERYDVVVGGNFIFGDFLEAFICKNNIQVKRMVINTLSLSQENADSLANLLKAHAVLNLDLIISDYFYSNERRELIPYIYEQLDSKDNTFQLAVCSTHMKTVTMETVSGTKVVIHGSANLRSSGNIEQFSVEFNDELCDFYNSLTDEIIKTYGTINRSVRYKKLTEILLKTQNNGKR